MKRFFSLYTLIILIISVSALLLLEAQNIFYFEHTPPGNTYLGTIHYSPDYFNYLSWIKQGDTHILSSTLLYTEEDIPDTFVRWFFVLIGRIGSLFGFNPIVAYHAAVVAFSLSFMISGFILIREIIQAKLKQIFAYFFFVYSTAWPVITMAGGTLHFDYHWFWYNTGNFFSRFGPTPHHLLSNTLFCLSSYFFVVFLRKKSTNLANLWIFLFLSAFLGLLLASLVPTFWLLAAAAIGFTTLVYPMRLVIRGQGVKSYAKSVIASIPFFAAYFVGGFIAASYLKEVYSVSPYSYVTAWEKWQQLHMDVPTFIYASGPVVILFFFGSIALIGKAGAGIFYVISLLAAGLLLYFSNMPFLMGLMNVRFWPSGMYVFMAILAVNGIEVLGRLFRGMKPIFISFAFLIYCFLTFTSIAGQLRGLLTISNGYGIVYMPNDVMDVYAFAEQNTSMKARFLVQYPYNESFPALTGRKAVWGDPISHLTLDAATKTAIATKFFDGSYGTGEALEVLRLHRVTHVLVFSSNHAIDKYPFLHLVMESANVKLFEVSSQMSI